MTEARIEPVAEERLCKHMKTDMLTTRLLWLIYLREVDAIYGVCGVLATDKCDSVTFFLFLRITT